MLFLHISSVIFSSSFTFHRTLVHHAFVLVSAHIETGIGNEHPRCERNYDARKKRHIYCCLKLANRTSLEIRRSIEQPLSCLTRQCDEEESLNWSIKKAMRRFKDISLTKKVEHHRRIFNIVIFKIIKQNEPSRKLISLKKICFMWLRRVNAFYATVESSVM